jgi:hypothetical protein
MKFPFGFKHSILNPHLKFFVHVCYSVETMSLEEVRRYGYLGGVEKLREMQNLVLGSVPLARRATTRRSESIR